MVNQISPAAFIGEGVELGDNIIVGPGAVVLGPCVIADNVWIGPGAQIGAPPEMSNLPQNAAWDGDLQHAGVRIEAGAVIREAAVIHQGSYRETTIGARSWILNRAYIAHDVLVGEATTVSAGVSIGGHCIIGARVNIGMNAVVHQRRIIADGAMIGMGTPVTRDVPPFAKVYGTPPRLAGVNSVGAERAGHDTAAIEVLAAAYAVEEFFLTGDIPASLASLQAPVTIWRSHENTHPVTVRS